MSTYKKLKPEAKEQWLKALRSGRYKQVDGQLGRKTGDKTVSYCCLGVCVKSLGFSHKWQTEAGYAREERQELVIKRYPNLAKYNDHDEDGNVNHESGSLPDWARNIIGLSPAAEQYLISMNDGGKSFTEIADWIEKTL